MSEMAAASPRIAATPWNLSDTSCPWRLFLFTSHYVLWLRLRLRAYAMGVWHNECDGRTRPWSPRFPVRRSDTHSISFARGHGSQRIVFAKIIFAKDMRGPSVTGNDVLGRRHLFVLFVWMIWLVCGGCSWGECAAGGLANAQLQRTLTAFGPAAHPAILPMEE